MDRLSYGPYLYALSPDVLAVLTMHGKSVIIQCLLIFEDSQCTGPLCTSMHTYMVLVHAVHITPG